jgi:hypothetical protein
MQGVWLSLRYATDMYSSSAAPIAEVSSLLIRCEYSRSSSRASRNDRFNCESSVICVMSHLGWALRSNRTLHHGFSAFRPSEPVRRHTKELPVAARKMAVVVKPGLHGDLSKRQVRFRKKLLRAFQSPPHQIMVGRHADRLLERSREMPKRQSACVCACVG